MDQDDVIRCVSLLANLVAERRVTHRSLDRLLGWKAGTVSRNLRKEREDIRLSQLLAILGAIEVSPLDFFEQVFRKAPPLADRISAHLRAASPPLAPLMIPEHLSSLELEDLIKRALREVLREREEDSE